MEKLFVTGDYQFALLDDGTAVITKYQGKERSLEIPSSLDGHAVTAIGDSVFFDCDSLTSVTIPDNVTAIGANPFAYCNSLTHICVSPDHPTLATIDGVLFRKTDWRLVCYPCSFTKTTYAIPEGIEIIGSKAFHCCKRLASIILPNSLTTIGDSAFFWCDSLTSVTIPDSVTSIGYGAFDYCDNLKEIIVGRNSYARQYCINHNLPYTYADANAWLNH